jgi:hypothetical protein
MGQQDRDERAERDKQEQSKGDRPPVDGPGSGSGGEPKDPEGKDLSDSSAGRPGDSR